MESKKRRFQFNIFYQCQKYRIPLWQCPQFIFLITGFIIIGTMIVSYIIGARYIENPEIVALMIIGITVVLFVIDFILVRSFEKMAEANRMKSEFISIVSHQLRSPLSNLRWIIEILMSGKLGKIEEAQTEYFRILKENTDRMRELVGNLLVVSRIEQQKLPIRKEMVSLKKIVEELIKEFELAGKTSKVKMEFTVQKDLPEIFTDPCQLKLVVENLLDNAVRYIKNKGEVKITLKKQKNNIYFEVKDTGVGIPKEDQKYIFQKFFRSKNTLEYQTQGSGLGLYIAKSIIEKLGGKINFRSEKGKGSTFWFTLPIENKIKK
ncbi:HAMP domain-containing histidine kinase [bacterium]|nr:HAMP domain-containing histidine kinase [bacterium]